MYTVIPVGGVPGGECYLLTTEDRAILIDSGFPCKDRQRSHSGKDSFRIRLLFDRSKRCLKREV